ncbi:uncharacterized protein LOC135118557 [Helicoverpa armigera]|uniref:uncharacterized protein LOC135118557 n=1 Tax=Helicoverpa armigera TaxID=29058 RepID=UPI00308305C1
MTRFWETEEISDTAALTNEDQYCEDFYKSTTERLADGKYVVQMPMKANYSAQLGATKSQAQAQFLQLERKMLRNSDLRREYHRFMEEYISLGHMKPITAETRSKNQVYLPHHGVLRAESTTTKLRVVFNASYKANNNNSLNDLMYSGPNLQKDMFTLLINWRTYRYVFTADVEKMFRYIWLKEEQQHLQTIVWRSSTDEPLREWQLCTVTYGMKSAPFLAMRTLHQLAQDEKDNYPESANALQNYFYMDDLVHGQNSIEDAKRVVAELIALLKKGGFNLRKWTSNEASILEGLPDNQKSTKANIEFSPETSNTKMLGMMWNQKQDTFTYQWRLCEQKSLTKRILLSEISKLYDPLGFLSPATIKAKLLFQKVWISKTNWDDSLPYDITAEWEKLRKEFPSINKISVTRWLQCTEDTIEIHGFCDASEKAYACVVYSRVKNSNGDFTTTIIAAKTKVAPLSKKMSLPRLELCGALLLAKLMEKIKSTLSYKNLQIHCWSDSKVVLAWLQGDINRWDKYVANRVTQINNIIPAKQWDYVKSEENSADCATRGR